MAEPEKPITLDYSFKKDFENSGCRDCLSIIGLYVALGVLLALIAVVVAWRTFR